MTSLPPSGDAPPPRANQPSEGDPSARDVGLSPLIARALGAGPDVVPGTCSVCGAAASLLRVTRDEEACLVCLRCFEDGGSEELRTIARFFRHLAMPVDRTGQHLSPELPPSTVCAVCGVTFADVNRTGLLGCPSCYDAFQSAVTAGLQRLHPIP